MTDEELKEKIDDVEELERRVKELEQMEKYRGEYDKWMKFFDRAVYDRNRLHIEQAIRMLNMYGEKLGKGPLVYDDTPKCICSRCGEVVQIISRNIFTETKQKEHYMNYMEPLGDGWFQWSQMPNPITITRRFVRCPNCGNIVRELQPNIDMS